MNYVLVNRLTPVDSTLTFTTVDEWKTHFSFDTDDFLEIVPGLTSLDMVLESNMKSVMITKTYETVQDRLNHVQNFAIPSFRNELLYSTEFVSETEVTPDASVTLTPP